MEALALTFSVESISHLLYHILSNHPFVSQAKDAFAARLEDENAERVKVMRGTGADIAKEQQVRLSFDCCPILSTLAQIVLNRNFLVA